MNSVKIQIGESVIKWQNHVKRMDNQWNIPDLVRAYCSVENGLLNRVYSLLNFSIAWQLKSPTSGYKTFTMRWRPIVGLWLLSARLSGCCHIDVSPIYILNFLTRYLDEKQHHYPDIYFKTIVEDLWRWYGIYYQAICYFQWLCFTKRMRHYVT